jgi:hypothetical protein
MRQFGLFMAGIAGIVIIIAASAGLWAARGYLPAFGIFVLGASCVLVCIAIVGIIVRVKNEHQIIHRGDVVVIRHRGDFYHASAYHMAAQYGKQTMLLPERAATIIDAEDTQQIEAPHIYSFAELLRQRIVQKAVSEEKLILGYVDGVLRYGSWLDLYSCAIAGTSGSGKTTTVLFLLFQAILCGAKIVLIDPHLNNLDESLAARLAPLKKAFHGNPIDDSNPEAVLYYVQWFRKELARRKQAGKKGALLIFCIDEFNAVMRMPDVKKELAELLVSIEQEGRKFGIFALLIGQVWTAQQIGGADLRRSLASRIVHRIDEEYAKLLLGSKYGQKCIELEVGSSWFRDTNGGTNKMLTPATYKEDGYTIAEILGWQEVDLVVDEWDIPASETGSQNGNRPLPEPTNGNWFRQPGKRREVDTEKLDIVREMLKNRKSQNEIVSTVFPGMRNADAIVEYRNLVAVLMEGEA